MNKKIISCEDLQGSFTLDLMLLDIVVKDFLSKENARRC